MLRDFSKLLVLAVQQGQDFDFLNEIDEVYLFFVLKDRSRLKFERKVFLPLFGNTFLLGS
jgi:hypothetical protein